MENLKDKKHLSVPKGSRMLEELSQLKIYGGRSIEAQKLEIKDNGYFESVREFLTSKISGTINPDKYEAIKAEFESDNIFSNLALPNCPHCEKCPVIEKCISKRNIDFAIEYMKKCNVNSLKNNQYGKS